MEAYVTERMKELFFIGELQQFLCLKYGGNESN